MSHRAERRRPGPHRSKRWPEGQRCSPRRHRDIRSGVARAARPSARRNMDPLVLQRLAVALANHPIGHVDAAIGYGGAAVAAGDRHAPAQRKLVAGKFFEQAGLAPGAVASGPRHCGHSSARARPASAAVSKRRVPSCRAIMAHCPCSYRWSKISGGWLPALASRATHLIVAITRRPKQPPWGRVPAPGGLSIMAARRIQRSFLPNFAERVHAPRDCLRPSRLAARGSSSAGGPGDVRGGGLGCLLSGCGSRAPIRHRSANRNLPPPAARRRVKWRGRCPARSRGRAQEVPHPARRGDADTSSGTGGRGSRPGESRFECSQKVYRVLEYLEAAARAADGL